MLMKMRPVKHIIGLFPILEWSRTYSWEKGIGDLIAGITIALTLIPQSMGYAMLAGLPPQYGLYASLVGGFMYALMGTIPQINIGPTALLSLLTVRYTMGVNVDFAILLCLVAGIIQLIAAILQLGFLVEFISIPVVSGFTSAAALTVASSQIKGLLGLKFTASSFITSWKGIFTHFKNIRMSDALLSFCCITILIAMENLQNIPIKPGTDDRTKHRAVVKKRVLWFIGISRNAVVVILATIMAAIMHRNTEDPFILTGKIIPGIPAPKIPPFKTVVNDKTYTFVQMLSHLGFGILVVPLVGILGNVAIAKAFTHGKKLRATHEILALGVCNIVGSFFSSMPVNGSLSRSAVSEASGVKTPAAGIYTGFIVVLTLLLLTPYFFYIPRATLSSVIICAVLRLVDHSILKIIWKYSKLDLIPLVVSFFCCLGFGIAIGLLCGIVADVIIILYYQFRPLCKAMYVEEGALPAHFAIHFVGGFAFPGADNIRLKLDDLQQKHSPVGDDAETLARSQVNNLVIYCDQLYRMDFTFMESLQILVAYWCITGRAIFCDVRPDIKKKLSDMLPGVTFCNSDEVKTHLTDFNTEDSTSVPT